MRGSIGRLIDRGLVSELGHACTLRQSSDRSHRSQHRIAESNPTAQRLRLHARRRLSLRECDRSRPIEIEYDELMVRVKKSWAPVLAGWLCKARLLARLDCFVQARSSSNLCAQMHVG